jgi:hypothetical protein
MKKKSSKIHKECLNNFFWPRFLPKTLYMFSCIKGLNVTKTKCPIALKKISKKKNSWDFEPLIKHGLH